MSETKHLTIMKFIMKHKLLFGCLLLVWLLGMLLTLNVMGKSAHTKVQYHHTSHPMLHPLQHNRLPPQYSFKMMKANRYCNPPNDISYNHEGRAPGNYTLIFVSAVIRHGDRSPMRPIRNQSVIDCSSEDRHPLLKKYLATLKLVPKQGKKLYPFSTFTLHPNEKRCSSAQLTIIGAQQHLQLGYQLNRIYNRRLRLLTKANFQNHFKVYSTIYSRTFQSAIAFLFGFLPEFNFSKLKIVPSADLRFCFSKDYCNCPILEHLQKVLDKKLDRLMKSHPAVVRLLQRLNPIVKLHPNHSDITTANAMFDSLMGYVCHGSHLPCMPGTHNCITIDHVRNVMAYLEWQGKQFVEDNRHKKLSRLKTQGFLINLLQHMQQAVDQPDAERFVLYSGHDITLMPLASTLGYDDGNPPPYASRLIFELYAGQNDQGKQKYVIKLLFNGKDITKYTPFCRKIMMNAQSRTSVPDTYVCPYENFVHFVKEGFFHQMNASSFQEACSISTLNAEEDTLTVDAFKDIIE